MCYGRPLARVYILTTTATMVGGTQLFEGAHLTGGIRFFVENQANVTIMRFVVVKSSIVPRDIEGFDSKSQMCHH